MRPLSVPFGPQFPDGGMAMKSALFLLQCFVQVTAQSSKGEACCREMAATDFWRFAPPNIWLQF